MSHLGGSQHGIHMHMYMFIHIQCRCTCSCIYVVAMYIHVHTYNVGIAVCSSHVRRLLLHDYLRLANPSHALAVYTMQSISPDLFIFITNAPH